LDSSQEVLGYRIYEALTSAVVSYQILIIWVAGFLRNQWLESIGMGGRLPPESVDGMERNMQNKQLDQTSGDSFGK
jgi:hypothetical protein